MAAAHGCAGRRPVCGPFPRLGFAARVRCGPSPGVVRLRGRGAGGRGQLGCLRLSRRPPIAPEFPACVAPVACSPLIWSPGGRSPQPPALQARSDAPRETREGSRRRWPSGLLWPLSPPAGRPRVSSAYIAVSRRSSCPCSAQDVAPSRPSAICGRRTPESVLRAAAAARPTARRFQRIPGDPHAMEAGTARLRGRPHSMLRRRVVFDCAAAWTRPGVRVTRGRRPWRRRTSSDPALLAPDPPGHLFGPLPCDYL